MGLRFGRGAVESVLTEDVLMTYRNYGVCKSYIGVIQGLYGDNGKSGSYCLGFPKIKGMYLGPLGFIVVGIRGLNLKPGSPKPETSHPYTFKGLTATRVTYCFVVIPPESIGTTHQTFGNLGYRLQV